MLKSLQVVGYVSTIIGTILAILAVAKIIVRYFERKKRLMSERKKQLFESVICNDDFHKWKSEILLRLYNEIEGVKIFGKIYPIICFEAPKDMEIIKEQINNLDITPCEEVVCDNDIAKKLVNEYSLLMSNYISRPNQNAYALNEIFFNDSKEVIDYTARTCEFLKALKSTFVLEYELYYHYSQKKLKKRLDDSADGDLINNLNLRNAIHGSNKNNALFENGSNRIAIMSVQMFVLCLSNKDNSYKTIIAKRSNKVSYGPGTWQFMPAGYFESFDTDNSRYSISKNFNSYLTIQREMLEELFGRKEFISNKDGYPIDNIENDSVNKYISNQIANKRAHIRFLGIVLDLITLTYKLSYMLIIDDTEFSNMCLTPNFEAKTLYTPTLGGLEELVANDWLLPESAGLLSLALEHPLVKSRLSNKPISFL